jgi:hypothetical protein
MIFFVWPIPFREVYFLPASYELFVFLHYAYFVPLFWANAFGCSASSCWVGSKYQVIRLDFASGGVGMGVLWAVVLWSVTAGVDGTGRGNGRGGGNEVLR